MTVREQIESFVRREITHIDPEVLDALHEVDACTPDMPPLVPRNAVESTRGFFLGLRKAETLARPSVNTPQPSNRLHCGAVLGRHTCVKRPQHDEEPRRRFGEAHYYRDYHQAGNGTLWLERGDHTGFRPQEVSVNARTHEFALPDGNVVSADRVNRDGWIAVLEEIALR